MSGLASLLLMVSMIGGITALPYKYAQSSAERRADDFAPHIKMELSVQDLIPPFLARILAAKGMNKLLESRIEGRIPADSFMLNLENEGQTKTDSDKPATPSPPTPQPPIVVIPSKTTQSQQTTQSTSQSPPTISVPTPPHSIISVVETVTPPSPTPPTPSTPATAEPFHVGNIPITAPTRSSDVKKRDQLLDALKRILAEN